MTLNKANEAIADELDEFEGVKEETVDNQDDSKIDNAARGERSYLLQELKKNSPVAQVTETAAMPEASKETPPLTPPRQIEFKPPPATKTPPPAMKTSAFMSPDFLAANVMKMKLDDDDAAPATADESVAPSTKGSSEGYYEWARKQDGSRSSPYLTYINLNCPEISRDFEGQYCPTLERNGWQRPGVHVRHLINNLDMDMWSAEIPEEGEFAEFEGRCFLVKRPSHDACMKKPDLYHKKNKLDDVKQVHKNHKTKHDWVHHLIYFNEGVILENAHFAGEQTRVVETKHNPVKIEKHENEFDCNIRLLYVYWEIAFASGGMKIFKDNRSQANKKNIFD